MHVSYDLLVAVRLVMEQANSKEKQARVEDLLARVDEYERACQLARGPLPERAAHWEARAASLEGRLKLRVARLLNVPLEKLFDQPVE